MVRSSIVVEVLPLYLCADSVEDFDALLVLSRFPWTHDVEREVLAIGFASKSRIHLMK